MFSSLEVNQSVEAHLLLVETVQSVLDDKLILVDKALVGVKVVPLGLLALATVGEDADGDAQNVCQAVELALGLVVRVERFISLQELEEVRRAGDSFLHELTGFTLNFDLKYVKE